MTVWTKLTGMFKKSDYYAAAVKNWHSPAVSDWMKSSTPPDEKQFDAAFRAAYEKASIWKEWSEEHRAMVSESSFKREVLDAKNPKQIGLYKKFLQEEIASNGYVHLAVELQRACVTGATDAHLQILEEFGAQQIINVPLARDELTALDLATVNGIPNARAKVKEWGGQHSAAGLIAVKKGHFEFRHEQ